MVPPAQAESIAAELTEHRIRHAYLAFEDESHGFRKANTIMASLEAELSFYGQVLGFEPLGVTPIRLTDGTASQDPKQTGEAKAGQRPTARRH